MSNDLHKLEDSKNLSKTIVNALQTLGKDNSIETNGGAGEDELASLIVNILKALSNNEEKQSKGAVTGIGTGLRSLLGFGKGTTKENTIGDSPEFDANNPDSIILSIIDIILNISNDVPFPDNKISTDDSKSKSMLKGLLSRVPNLSGLDFKMPVAEPVTRREEKYKSYPDVCKENKDASIVIDANTKTCHPIKDISL